MTAEETMEVVETEAETELQAVVAEAARSGRGRGGGGGGVDSAGRAGGRREPRRLDWACGPLKDCMACSRTCGERFSHLTMAKGQFVCGVVPKLP
jgi:hypothetical protein